MQRTYEIAIRVFRRLVPSPVKQDLSALLFGTGNQPFNSRLALRADDRTEISAFFEATIDLEFFRTLRELGEPGLRLADHDEGAQRHTALARSTESRARDGVQRVILVAVGHDSGVVLCAKIGLDTFALCGSSGVDVFASLVAADKADGFDGRLIDDEVDGLCGAMDNVDDAFWVASLLSELSEDHGGAWITFGWLDYEGVARDGGNWYRP